MKIASREQALIKALKKDIDRIEQLCHTVNTLSHQLGLGQKVVAEHFTDNALQAIKMVQA